jgi:DNA-binding LytR/AlgR family response regulator
MKILIIEDEMPAAAKIQRLLKEINHEYEILAVLDSVTAAVDYFQKSESQPDLILSDIQLSDGFSFDIFDIVVPPCPIIFTTAFDEYALKSFELLSVDYLLKPISKEKLARSLEKFQQYFSKKDEVTNLPANDEKIENTLLKVREMINSMQKNYKERFLVKSGEKLQPVNEDQIAYFFADEKYVFLVTHQKTRFLINLTLDHLQNVLNPQKFFRLNRKMIANIGAITSVEPYFSGRLIVSLLPIFDEEVSVSREKSQIFKDWLENS